MWAHLSQNLDPDDPSYSEAQRRVMARLGEYASSLVTPLKARPTGATLLLSTPQRIEVRVATATSHIVLALAPDLDLAHEVFFLRSLAQKELPAPRLITYDLTCATVPFTYAIESYLGGMTLGQVKDVTLLRVAARQVGRALRRVHQIEAPGFGAPTPGGRWPAHSWPEALASWFGRRVANARAEDTLGAEALALLHAATLAHPSFLNVRPRVLHGALEPGRILVTVGETVQLEALLHPEPPVAGDPLFDLAYALSPRHPTSFRQGVLEGYEMSGALDEGQYARLDRLRLLIDVANALTCGEADVLKSLADAVLARAMALADT